MFAPLDLKIYSEITDNYWSAYFYFDSYSGQEWKQKMKIGLTDFPPERKGEGKIQYKHSHSEHYGFMSFWNPGKCLDSVCPCSVEGTDMKYSSVGGEAWLETFHLPTLNYPQLLLNWKIKQDPGFSFLILLFFILRHFWQLHWHYRFSPIYLLGGKTKKMYNHFESF